MIPKTPRKKSHRQVETERVESLAARALVEAAKSCAADEGAMFAVAMAAAEAGLTPDQVIGQEGTDLLSSLCQGGMGTKGAGLRLHGTDAGRAWQRVYRRALVDDSWRSLRARGEGTGGGFGGDVWRPKLR